MAQRFVEMSIFQRLTPRRFIFSCLLPQTTIINLSVLNIEEVSLPKIFFCIFESTKLAFLSRFCKILLYVNKGFGLILANGSISLRKMHKNNFEISSCLCTL